MPRLAGLSDGVFAFALTLLVLDIRLPEGILASELQATFFLLLPRLLVYIISFVVIGATWGSHQRILGQIVRGDGPLVWLNLFLLFFITLLPASSVLLGRFPRLLAPIVIFGVNVVFIQLAAYLIWRHARVHSLINNALDPRVVTGVGRRLGMSALMFALAIPLYFVQSAAVFAVWAATEILLLATDWLSWYQAGRTRSWSIPAVGVGLATFRVKHGAGTLAIRRSASVDMLLDGTFGGGVESLVTHQGDKLEARLQIPQKRGFMSFRYPWAWGPANSLDWTLDLHPLVPIHFFLELSGGQANLDFTGIALWGLEVHASASSLRIVLPQSQMPIQLSIESTVTSVTLVVPSALAGRIRSKRSLRNADFDRGRFVPVADDHEFCSPGFAQAEGKVDMVFDVGWGSIGIVSDS